jgi:hypothetical protein
VQHCLSSSRSINSDTRLGAMSYQVEVLMETKQYTRVRSVELLMESKQYITLRSFSVEVWMETEQC